MNYKVNKQAINITATILVAVIVLWLGWVIFVPTTAMNTAQRVHVSSGQGLTVISNMLKERGLVRSAVVFRFYVAGLGRERNLKAGDYDIPAGATLNDIAWQIAGGKGASTDIVVFIPEGSNIWEIDKRLADVKLITEGEFASAYGSREGYLFPDTYRFRPESLLGEIEQKMELNGQDKIQALIGELSLPAPAQIPNSKFQTKDCDVTQVGVGKEIKIDSVYNTYTRAGLPPHPISNPGLISIKAALNPQGDYLYYLSTRDGSQIIFSKTGAEHIANRRKYLGL